MSLTATEHHRSLAHRPRGRSAHTAAPGMHATWLGGGLLLAFAVPFVLADVLETPRDLYYGLYAFSVAALFGGWVWATGDPKAALLRRWRLGLVLGLASAALLVPAVMAGEDATSRPGAVELALAVLWRGVVYGAADGILLAVFPVLVVVAAFGGLRGGLGRRALVLGAALAASLLFTAVYHLGYSDFRSGKVAKPVTADVVWSAPTLATLSPLGAPVAHVGMHVAAVLHSYDTDLYLPPHDSDG